jgi:hypothetical protein
MTRKEALSYMYREPVIALMQECNTEREMTLVKLLLAVVDERPEDAYGLAELFIATNPIPEEKRL